MPEPLLWHIITKRCLKKCDSIEPHRGTLQSNKVHLSLLKTKDLSKQSTVKAKALLVSLEKSNFQVSTHSIVALFYSGQSIGKA